jgi:hypothetical protein
MVLVVIVSPSGFRHEAYELPQNMRSP